MAIKRIYTFLTSIIFTLFIILGLAFFLKYNIFTIHVFINLDLSFNSFTHTGLVKSLSIPLFFQKFPIREIFDKNYKQSKVHIFLSL